MGHVTCAGEGRQKSSGIARSGTRNKDEVALASRTDQNRREPMEPFALLLHLLYTPQNIIHKTTNNKPQTTNHKTQATKE